MHIAICDDDKEDIERLRALLVEYGKMRDINLQIDVFESAAAFTNAIKKDMYDIIFLDINMEDQNGLEIALKVRKEMGDVPIILVTAYLSYALEGYKVEASRFLIKDDLDRTINECMDDILARLKRRRETMCFSCVEGDINLKLSDILYIEVRGHRSEIHLKDGSYHMYEPIESIEKRLKDLDFSRVHQSYVVNLRHVRKINNYTLTLDTGREITVPKSRYKKTKEEYALYVGRSI